MASAGKILIMPKGEYNPSATYEVLDMVKYNGTTWLAKKTSSGIEPSDVNAEYWFNLLDFDPSDFETRKANGGSIRFTANPEGKNWIAHTMNLPNIERPRFFANVEGIDSLYVTGVTITDYQPDLVRATFYLNQPVDYDVTLVVGYMY